MALVINSSSMACEHAARFEVQDFCTGKPEVVSQSATTSQRIILKLSFEEPQGCSADQKVMKSIAVVLHRNPLQYSMVIGSGTTQSKVKDLL